MVTNDAHYARPEDRELQDVLVCIRHGQTLEESGHLRRPNGEYHLKSAAEMAALPPGTGELGESVARAWAEGIANAGEMAASARSTSTSSSTASRVFRCPSRRRRSPTSSSCAMTACASATSP